MKILRSEWENKLTAGDQILYLFDEKNPIKTVRVVLVDDSVGHPIHYVLTEEDDNWIPLIHCKPFIPLINKQYCGLNCPISSSSNKISDKCESFQSETNNIDNDEWMKDLKIKDKIIFCLNTEYGEIRTIKEIWKGALTGIISISTEEDPSNLIKIKPHNRFNLLNN